MAITDYDGLVEAVQKWCARSTTVFTTRIPDFVALAEDRIYNGAGRDGDPLFSEPLRATVLETSGTLTFTAGEAPQPALFLAAKRLFRASDKVGLDYLPPERWSVYAAGASGGTPGYYTTEAGVVRLSPSYTGTMELVYWARKIALSADAKENDLLTQHPMIYLEATLFEAFTWMRDVEAATAHLARFRAAVAGLNSTANKSRILGANVRVRSRNPIP